MEKAIFDAEKANIKALASTGNLIQAPATLDILFEGDETYSPNNKGIVRGLKTRRISSDNERFNGRTIALAEVEFPQGTRDVALVGTDVETLDYNGEIYVSVTRQLVEGTTYYKYRADISKKEILEKPEVETATAEKAAS